MARKQNVIFVCTGNSCRSQMAEGWAHHLHADALSPFSAGLEPRPLDPLAVRVMEEVGVDISTQESHAIEAFLNQDIDVAITVCSESTADRCPAFPDGVKVISHPFDDPPKLTAGMVDEEEKLGVYRRVRDEIREYVEGLPGQLADVS